MRTNEVCPVCKTYHDPACFIYVGNYLPITDAQPGDSINEILAKLDAYLATIGPTTTTTSTSSTTTSSTTTTTTTEIPFTPTYFVSNTGDDNNDGLSELTPWQTLAKVNATTFVPGDGIGFKKGDTWYGSLDPKASGVLGNPITYGAYGVGNAPIITGFTTVTGWVNEGGGIYSKVLTSQAETNIVTLDGVSQPMGRTPDYGSWLTYDTLVNNYPLPGYVLVDSSLTNSPNWTGAEVVVYLNGWDLARMTIDSHVDDTLYLTTLTWPGNPVDDLSNPKKYFFQNSLQTLSQLGEWYHDYSGTGKFYMYFGIEDPDNYEVKVATLDYLFKDYDGHDYLTVRNISFEGAIKTIIFNYTGNDNFILQNCDIKYAGVTGIKAYGNNTLVTRNTFQDINGCAVLLFGTDQIVTNNTIVDQGMIEGLGAKENIFRGAIRNYLGNNFTVTGNSLTNIGFGGIALLGPSLVATIKNNYIDSSCYWRPDMGGIYTTGRTGLQTDVLIEDNLVVGSDGEGIYCDEYSTNVRVINNTVAGSVRSGIFLHKSNNILVTGNNTYDCYTGFQMSNWVDEPNLTNLTVTGNNFVATGTQVCLRYSTRNTNYLATFADWDFSNNVYARPIDDNLTINTNLPVAGDVDYTLVDWQTLTNQDLNSNKSPKTIVDPADLYNIINYTGSAINSWISTPSVDVREQVYNGEVLIQSLKSLILIKGTILPSYYISNSGNDSNDGLTPDTPWQTMAKVNTIVKTPGDSFFFDRSSTFHEQFDINQSGSAGLPITFGAYGNSGQPIITGFSDVSDWVNIGGNIWQTTAPVSTLSYLNVVIVGGVNTPMGRLPKMDEVYIYQTHDTNVSITSSDLTGTPDWTGAEVLIRKRGWAYEKGVVTSQVGDTIYYTDSGVYSVDYDDCGFFFQNDPKCLTQEFDWYYDSATKLLQIYSMGTPPTVKVPTFDHLGDMFNRNYIVFDDIHFTGANHWAIFVNSADYTSIKRCTINNIGWHGITTYDDHFTTIDDNVITDCNHTAINIGGLTSSDGIVTNNLVSNIYMIPGIGQNVYPLGAICVTSDNTLVQYNDINYSGYNGIIASSADINVGVIKNNSIDNSLQKLSDGGGIYTANSHVNLLIEENLIFNSLGFPLGSPNQYIGAKGIYLDVNSENVIVNNNTITRCNIGMCMSADNISNVFDSNVVFDNVRELDVTNITSATYGTLNNNIITNNQFVTKNSSQTVAKFQSIFANDIQNFFSNIDSNIYARPINDTATIYYYQPSIVGPHNNQPLSEWRTFIGQEALSTASPYTIAAESELYMVYNNTKLPANISIPFSSKDLLGNIYTDFVTLQPYRSIILFQII